MSGYCLDCGNEMCVCNICECEECKQIPTMTFVSFEAYEKLQADNKTMKEALEFVRDTLDEEKINLGMIKAIDACIFHALEKVDQSTEIGS